MSDTEIVRSGEFDARILTLRGQRVMVSAALAALYGVPTKALNQAVKRNLDRFPSDFMFQLTPDEWAGLRSQNVTAKGRGGARVPPYAFTQEGVAMLSSVLNSPRAVQVNVEIMRAFVRLRRIAGEYAEFTRRLDDLEAKYDAHFAMVFEAIRKLMFPPEGPQRQIGFRRGEGATQE